METYLAGLDEPQRSTLTAVADRIRELVPQAEPVIAYGVPAFRVGKTNIAGLAAYAHHLSYLPHSGSVLASLADELDGYQWSKGALKFAVDEPLSRELIATLIDARLSELGLSRGDVGAVG